MNFHEKYLKYKSKYLNLKEIIYKNTNYNQIGGGNKKEIYLFKAEWCPHCIGFKPTWKKLEKEYNTKYNFITYDSEKDKESIKKWDIKGFPTIIKKIGNSMEEYVGPRDEESVKKFITDD